jgi:serpin B
MGNSPLDAGKQIAALVRGNTAFAFDLYKQLRERSGNLFFSPHSISTALAMTYAGARTDTEAEMAQALHFDGGQDATHPAFAALEARLNAIQAKGGVRLETANSLWPQTGHPLLPEYLALVKANYGVLITPLDFGEEEAARRTINDWAADKTAQKIQNLIPSGALNASTRLVLANAIYFKGDWAVQFDGELTADQPFYVTPDASVVVPMMFQTLDAGYAETPEAQIIELPYVGEEISFLALLPRDGLSELEAALTAETLAGWTQRLYPQEVEVYMPRFRLVQSFGLNGALMALGIRAAFGAGADFSGMDGRKHGLYVGAVLHKAFVEVNEEGTEAAAATAVLTLEGAPPPQPVFRADHPFLFLIRERATGAILFMGRVADPSQSAPKAPDA